MSLSVIDGDARINGTLAVNRFNPPAGSITDASVIASAGIQATKVIHQTAHHYEQDAGSAVVAQTRMLHTVYGQTALIVNMDVMTPTPPTGADTVTVDLQRGNPTTGFTSLLSSPVTLNNATVARTPIEAAIATTALADDDTLQIVVTPNHTTGALPQGLLVTVTLQEAPQ